VILLKTSPYPFVHETSFEGDGESAYFSINLVIAFNNADGLGFCSDLGHW